MPYSVPLFGFFDDPGLVVKQSEYFICLSLRGAVVAAFLNLSLAFFYLKINAYGHVDPSLLHTAPYMPPTCISIVLISVAQN